MPGPEPARAPQPDPDRNGCPGSQELYPRRCRAEQQDRAARSNEHKPPREPFGPASADIKPEDR